MTFKDFKDMMARNYDLVRLSEAGSVTLVAMIVFAFACTMRIVIQSETVRRVLHLTKHEEVRKVEPPKPVVLPKDIPVKIPPRVERLQKLNERITVRRDIKSKFKPKPVTMQRKTKVDFKSLKDIGSSVRGQMGLDYANRFGVEGQGTGIRATIEQFVIVQFQGGDWDCECHHKQGQVDLTKGSIPNLIREIERRTTIQVINKVPIAVRADSPEIHKSPFVYFTGRKEFTLTESEVENLQAYLLQGGAIVANSALPGRGSRFDIAFRREMKRVIPNLDFKPIGAKHRIMNAFMSFSQIPPGLNYWTEPVETIEIDGRTAVIYNLNDYGDLMLATVDETGNALKTGLSAADPTYRFEGPMNDTLQRHWLRNLFENSDDFATVRDGYMMNINFLTYLLTR